MDRDLFNRTLSLSDVFLGVLLSNVVLVSNLDHIPKTFDAARENSLLILQAFVYIGMYWSAQSRAARSFLVADTFGRMLSYCSLGALLFWSTMAPLAAAAVVPESDAWNKFAWTLLEIAFALLLTLVARGFLDRLWDLRGLETLREDLDVESFVRLVATIAIAMLSGALFLQQPLVLSTYPTRALELVFVALLTVFINAAVAWKFSEYGPLERRIQYQKNRINIDIALAVIFVWLLVEKWSDVPTRRGILEMAVLFGVVLFVSIRLDVKALRRLQNALNSCDDVPQTTKLAR